MHWNSSLPNQTALLTQDVQSATNYNIPIAIVLGIVLAILDLLTILGNLLVCVTVLTRRALRNTTNYFILSLSSSDLLLGIIVLPFSTINTLLTVTLFCSRSGSLSQAFPAINLNLRTTDGWFFSGASKCVH